MAEKQTTYLDLGFDSFGLNTVARVSFLSANANDAYFEVSENSVSNKKVKSVSADKITAGTLSAVTNVGDESIRLDGEDHSFKIFDASSRLQVYIQGQ